MAYPTSDTPTSGEPGIEHETALPQPHYRKTLSQDAEEENAEILPDGGTKTQYYWSGDDGILYHTEKEEDLVIPFFDTVADAERFLESQAEKYGTERYHGMVLRKTGNRKVEEATEVLTSQAGLADFG